MYKRPELNCDWRLGMSTGIHVFMKRPEIGKYGASRCTHAVIRPCKCNGGESLQLYSLNSLTFLACIPHVFKRISISFNEFVCDSIVLIEQSRVTSDSAAIVVTVLESFRNHGKGNHYDASDTKNITIKKFSIPIPFVILLQILWLARF